MNPRVLRGLVYQGVAILLRHQSLQKPENSNPQAQMPVDEVRLADGRQRDLRAFIRTLPQGTTRYLLQNAL